MEVREVFFRRVVIHLRLFLGIQMVEIAVEFIEAVIGRQHVIEIAEMVLAELSRRVALVLEGGCDGDRLFRHADGRGRNADF